MVCRSLFVIFHWTTLLDVLLRIRILSSNISSQSHFVIRLPRLWVFLMFISVTQPYYCYGYGDVCQFQQWPSVPEKTTDHKLYHIMLYPVYLGWAGFELTTLVVIGIYCIGICKSNYHTIINTTFPFIQKHQQNVLYEIFSLKYTLHSLYIYKKLIQLINDPRIDTKQYASAVSIK